MVSRVKCGSPIATKRMDHPPKKQPGRSSTVAGWCALVGVGLPALACSATHAEQAAGRAQEIAGGTADVSHQSVFLLARESMSSSALCTATLIAPNL